MQSDHFITESADHAAAYQHYYQTNDLQGYTGENVVQNSLAQFGDRQDLQDPLVVSGAIGIGNLVATGLAWANNRDEIDSLRTRVEKLESLLKSTCNKVEHNHLSFLLLGSEFHQNSVEILEKCAIFTIKIFRLMM